MPLPPDLVRQRVRNELARLRNELPYAEPREEQLETFPLQFVVRLRNVVGPEWRAGAVVDRTEHELLVAIHESYPEQKPVVRWRTPVFHPNIMSPEDGGYVCTALLDNWSFKSTIATFVKSVEVLLAQPNPASPFDTESCTRAASWFRRHPYAPASGPAPAPRELPRPRPAPEGGGG